ncbi:ribosomal-protein-alanine N-acetyltransferase [compost metagenome]
MFLLIRPIHNEDRSFLYQLYASTRYEEITLWGWDEQTIHHFLTLQWTAQQQSYALQYPDMVQSIICLDDLRIGRIIISSNKDALTLVDLALLPQYQNQQYGTKIVHQLQQEAIEGNKKLYLSVQKMNRAISLYSRLGFKLIGGNELYDFMEWTSQ